MIVRNIFVGRQPASDDPLRARLWAVVAIFGALAADQAVKRLLLSGAVDLNGTMLIPDVANVTFAWNRGVSFNLLWSNSDLGSLLLFAGAACIVAALLVWAFRARRVRVASSDRFDNWGCTGEPCRPLPLRRGFRFLGHAAWRDHAVRLQFGRYSDHAWHIWPHNRPAGGSNIWPCDQLVRISSVVT